MKILLVDDHNLFLEGIELILRRLIPNLEFLHAISVDAALGHLKVLPKPELVFTDLSLPGVSDIDALLAIKKAAPEIPAIVISASEETQTVKRAIANGAAGYIFKSTSDSEELSKALKTVLDGGVYLPTTALSSERIATANNQPDIELTPRQSEVLRWVIRGLANKQIAREMNISNDTVKSHLKAIYEILGVNNRTQAVYAMAHSNLKLN